MAAEGHERSIPTPNLNQPHTVAHIFRARCPNLQQQPLPARHFGRRVVNATSPRFLSLRTPGDSAGRQLTLAYRMRHICLMSEAIRPSAHDAIIEAAFSVLSRDPGASIADIAAHAGVGRATLHRYFPGRNDLISELARIALQEMDEAVEQACADASCHTEVVRIALAVLIPLGDRHGFLAVETLDHDEDLLAEIAQQQAATRDMIDAARKEGAFDAAIPTDWIVQVFDHLIFAGWESVRAGQTTPTQAGELAWRTLISGLRPSEQ